MKTFRQLYEDPDYIEARGIKFYNDDAVVFGYLFDKLYIAKQIDKRATHEVLMDKIKNRFRKNKEALKDILSERTPRWAFEHSGRLWMDKKVISFWENPRPSQIKKIIADFNKKQIPVDETWEMEVKNEQFVTLGDYIKNNEYIKNDFDPGVIHI